MRKTTALLVAFVLASVSASAGADTITLKNGGTREGTIVGQDASGVRLHINDGGLEATIAIDAGDIAKIERGPVKATPAPALPKGEPPPAAPSTTAAATPKPTATTAHSTASDLPPTRGFFAELSLSLIGEGPDDPRRLPPDLLALWKNAVQLDTAGKRAAELDALRAVDSAFSASPGGDSRLDGLSRHERQQPFGLWMAGVHWEVMSQNDHGGSFDLTDIRDSERPALIGLLKEKTDPALEPLKTYFPPIDPKTNKPAPFRPAQFQGISVENALDIKDKALLAHAILLAQMKLQPDMPGVDKQLLGTQLTNINHILSRCNELEPQAKAAQAKADRAKKLADEKAKH
jgi:hypothetical protein